MIAHEAARRLPESAPDFTQKPLQAIDWVIHQNRNPDLTPGDEKRLKKLALRSIIAITGHTVADDEAVETEAKKDLDHYDGLQQKRLVAACYLRLLPEPQMRWLSDSPWRPKIAAIFDSQFADDIYAEWRIDKSLMAHEKMARLAESVRAEEEHFEQALQTLTSLERLNTHRQGLMKALNSRAGQALICPFLPKSIGDRLSEVYKSVELYIEQRNDLSIVDARARVDQELQRFIHLLETNASTYSQWMVQHLCTNLSTLVDKDFAKNKAAQPAKVFVKARDKKYPFHLAGQVTLFFAVKNEGPGYAYGTRLQAISDDSVKLGTSDVTIGRLAPGITHLVDIPTTVVKPQQQVEVFLQLDWHNFDRTPQSYYLSCTAEAQKSDVDWERLEPSDPYSLEPVSSEQELVGRKTVLNRLIGTVKAPKVGSSIIHGQKRVGKTSIAKALGSHLAKIGYLVVYLMAGDYLRATAEATVASLGATLCRRVKEADQRLAHLDVPDFEEALSPLSEFLHDVTTIIPSQRIIIILDEFDQLPLNLYMRGSLGDAFFETLRSISSSPNVGFILVGGEGMTHIMDCQGIRLNKWSVIPVDYFTRESEWPDYRELVQRPVAGTLEYAEDALIALHEATVGNPYFTKLVCQYVFRAAAARRDCYISRTEIEQAIQMAVREAAMTTFQHFWDDGIFETGDRKTEKSIRRRKVLIAVSDVLSKQSPAPYKPIADHPLVRDIADVDNDLKEFSARKVLITNLQDETYEFKVRLFQRWLKGCGIQDVIATFSDLDAALKRRQEEERQKVQPSEIVELVKLWGNYKGQPTTDLRVQVWLDQFDGVQEQRAMFAILRGLRFYSDGFVRQKLAEADGILRRALIRHLDTGKLKRSDILVSYLDSPGKSGAEFAKLYADEAEIYVDNVVERCRLPEVLDTRPDVKAVVFLDDFVGTGDQASENLKDLDAKLASIVLERALKVVFVAVVAYVGGWKHVEAARDELKMPVEIHACEMLDETMRCFGEKSRFYPDPSQREFAMRVAERCGKMLEKDCPLGYGNLQLAVVFEHSCPNDSLPILWSESAVHKWIPLFKRN